VLPHPKVVESFLGKLFDVLEVDQERGRALLRQFMPPLIITPQGDGTFRLSGGFDVEATFEVCDPKSRRDRV
jgi:hypothetical protein